MGPRRRAVVASVATGLAGLAGCFTSVSSTDRDDGSGRGTPGNTETAKTASLETATPDDGTECGCRSAWRADASHIPAQARAATDVPPLMPVSDPTADNPVLTGADVTDVDALFVADPFLFVTRDGEWHMFFEVLAEYGVVGHAMSPDRGCTWEYDRVVLDAGSHVSFPYVFEHRGERYLVIQHEETSTVVRLYRASSFPTEWEEVAVLFDAADFGDRIVDNPVFRWDGRWWMLGYGYEGRTNAYYADSPAGPWRPHADNPVVSDRPAAARPAGRPVPRREDVLVFYQDVEAFYGEKVRAYRITELTPESFADEEVPESPVLDGVAPVPEEADDRWNSLRMHHYDPWYLGAGDGWRVAVDGSHADAPGWSIGIYRVFE